MSSTARERARAYLSPRPGLTSTGWLIILAVGAVLGIGGAVVSALLDLDDRAGWLQTLFTVLVGALAGAVIVPLVRKHRRTPASP